MSLTVILILPMSSILSVILILIFPSLSGGFTPEDWIKL
jgi:ABC-type uncharacterized transport system YnjBCD permease subunit